MAKDSDSKDQSPPATDAAAPVPTRTLDPFPKDDPPYEAPVLKVEKIVGPCGEEPCGAG